MDILNNDAIKSAFNKVKEDIILLHNEILDLKITIDELKNSLISSTNRQTDTSTLRHLNTTDSVTSTHSSTDNSTVPQEIGGLKPLNLGISTGNEGASTDRQTDTSTDTSTHILLQKQEKTIESNIKQASEILDSLDSIKKEIRLKFKHLTPQEMAVFSSIYQLEEQETEVTYKSLSKQLKLSESSARDYVQRIITKGIPIKKHKLNNKKVILSISPDLKKIATLSTIIRLREL
ncbi:MAG: hypothetical protein ABIH37_03405 [archaeon]